MKKTVIFTRSSEEHKPCLDVEISNLTYFTLWFMLISHQEDFYLRRLNIAEIANKDTAMNILIKSDHLNILVESSTLKKESSTGQAYSTWRVPG